MARAGSNHKGGRPKGSVGTHTLESQELKKALISAYAENAKEINQALMDKAKSGDIPAIKEVLDRCFGKAPQAIVGEDGGALKIMFDTVFKDATTSGSKDNS